MFKRSMHPVIIMVIVLAAIGILYRLETNPSEFIRQIFISLVVVGVFILIYKIVKKKQVIGKNNEMNTKYQQAVRQSNKRLNDSSNHLTKVRGLSQKTPSSKKAFRTLKSSRRKDHNLTVIDGNKGKKKNRANF